MVSWLGKKILTFSMGRLSAGDPRPILLMDAGDMTMTFPGDNSWGGVVHGKAEHERWLRRFTKVGIRIWPDEVVLKGFPWKMTLCVRGRDYLRTADGETVYENRYVIWGHPCGARSRSTRCTRTRRRPRRSTGCSRRTSRRSRRDRAPAARPD